MLFKKLRKKMTIPLIIKQAFTLEKPIPTGKLNKLLLHKLLGNFTFSCVYRNHV